MNRSAGGLTLKAFTEPVRQLVHKAGRAYVGHLTQAEAHPKRSRSDNERPAEYSFALRQLTLAVPRPTTVLDVGTGRSSWPHLLYNCGFETTAIDNVTDYWPSDMVNRHWPVLDVDVTQRGSLKQTFDAVTCISVLEHIHSFDDAMRNMAEALRPGGLLILTSPYAGSQPHDPDVCSRPDAHRPPTHSYVCQSFNLEDLRRWRGFGLTLHAAEYWRMWTGPVFRAGQPTPWQMVGESERHQLGCFALRKV
jgi:2-polyprenyl-3-methyl-5-hydroxy-6-metoxy-1,4-benzoquinol methylase